MMMEISQENNKEDMVWIHNLPNICRCCEKSFDKDISSFKSGIFYIPSSNEIFLIDEVKQENRYLDTNKILYYCLQCYINTKLPSICSNCGLRTDDMKYKIHSNGREANCVQHNNDGNIILHNEFTPKTTLCNFCSNDLLGKGLAKKKEDEVIILSEIVSRECFICKRYEVDEKIIENKWYRFYSDNEFYSRQYGKGKLISDPLSFDYLPCIICDECFVMINTEPIPEINCDKCNNLYQSVFHSNYLNEDCGLNCSSIVTENGIYCNTGSSFKGENYFWKSGLMPIEFKNIKKICDQCIISLKENSIIELSKYNDLF
jgi:hypothetical protein